LAEVAFEQANYSQAANLASRALRLAPNVVRTLALQGDAYFKLLRFTEAKAAYQTAKKLSKGSSPRVTARLDRVNARLAP